MKKLITEFSRLQKLAGLLKEDETQDKLDDLSLAFKKGSVPQYVKLLQAHSKDKKVLAALRAGKTDGLPNDEKFDVEETTIPAKNLKPTQNEIGAEESLKNICTDQYGSLNSMLNGNPDVGSPIITYNGEYVLDGHHRWSQVYAANPEAKMKAVNVTGNIPAKDILKAVHTAIAVDAGETKTIPADLKAGNLLDYTSKQTYGYVLDELEEKARKVWADHGYDDDTQIAKHIVRNVSTMIKTSKPETWAPKRDFMPQPEKSGAENWAPPLKDGEINLLNPKTKDVKEESVNRNFENNLFEAVLKKSIKEFNKTNKHKK
jgi:hypothetical protein